jgi:hypothetical protein
LIDHCGKFSGTLLFRELGVKAVVHAFPENDLKGGKVGMGSEYGPKLFHGEELRYISQDGVLMITEQGLDVEIPHWEENLVVTEVSNWNGGAAGVGTEAAATCWSLWRKDS